jgi:hypothetical protein
MLRTPRTLVVLALAALCALLAACGGGGSANPNDTIKKAFATPIKSAKVDVEIELDLNGVKQVKGPVKLSITGPFVSGQGKTLPKLDFDIAGSASGQSFNAGFISTGTNAYVSFQGQAYELGTATVGQINQQIRAAAAKKNKGGLGQLGIHPSSWLTGTKDEGTSNIDGVQTDHVSAAVDVGKFLDDLNTLIQKAGSTLGGSSPTSALTPQEKQQIEQILGSPRFDVYVGKADHVLRRLSAHISFKIPKADQSQLSGLTDGTLSFSVEFSNVGQPQSITAPTSAKPLSDLTSKLGGLSGVIGGATGSSSAGGGTASAGSTADKLAKYSQCLQKADPSKPRQIAKCDALLK